MSVVTRTDDLGRALEAARPVDLAELSARASLQTRVDRKYLLGLPDASALITGLGEEAQVLEIDGARSFGYESVYFDTPDLACYRLAAHRRPARFKVRTRTYLDSDGCWLEVKTRDRRGRTVKHRHEYGARDRETLTAEGAHFVEEVLTSVGIDAAADTLEPTLVTRYRRSSLYLARDDSRVTVDTGLVCLGVGERSVQLSSRAVVESKTALHASSADRLLWSRGHRPLRISKYGTGMAALDPGLPSTTWRPVLRRHPFEIG